MRGVGDHLSVGERVAFYRRRRGLTQKVLAELVGRSEDWLSKVERGDRTLRRLDVIAELAQALRVTLGDLLGQPVLMEDDHQNDDDVPAIRNALMNHRRLSRLLFDQYDRTPTSQATTTNLAKLAREDFQRGRLGRVISLLPQLITDAQVLEDSAAVEGGLAWATSARIHHLASTTLGKLGESDLAWIAAERAMAAADRSGDPLIVAATARASSSALMAIGRHQDAVQLGTAAVEWVLGQVDATDPVALSLCGMLYLRTAEAAALTRDRSIANEMLDSATLAANRLGRDANYWQTSFGPTNVQLHKITIALDFEDIGYVVETGPAVDTTALQVERNASFRIDLARALSYVAKDEDALDQLLTAERVAPQLVRHSVATRETVRTMYRRAPATGGSSSPLFGLAERCRAVQ